MKNPWKIYQAWEEQRWRRNVPWWERKRANGEAHYARETALVWGGLLVVFNASYDLFVEHKFSYFKLLISIPLYLMGGYALGLWTWRDNERRYRKLSNDGAAPPDEQVES